MRKKVRLTLATRRALWIFCEAPREITTSVAQKINELYNCFSLGEAEDAIDRMGALKKGAAKIAGEPEGEAPVTWKELLAVPGEKEYEIDGVYLKWLSKELESHNWAKVVVQRGGQVTELNVPFNLHQSRALALLEQAIDAAQEVS